MLPALNIPALVSPLCPSLPHTIPSGTAKQWHERYHLYLGCVEQYLSLYRFPSPSPSLSPSLSLSPSPALSPSRPVFNSLSRSLSHLPVCAPYPRHCHFHCHRQDSSFHRSALQDPPSSPHHHPRRLSHSNLVVQRPGSRLACTAGSLVAQSLP